MKLEDIVELLKQGKKPVVKLTDILWEDSWGGMDMIARITSFKDHYNGGEYDTTELLFDFNEHKAHNLSLQGHNYYLKAGGTGTAFEAGMMDIYNIVEEVHFDNDTDVSVEIVEGGFLGEYLNNRANESYVEWLEKELTEARAKRSYPCSGGD